MQFVTDFSVLYRSRDELVNKNGALVARNDELQKANAALGLQCTKLEASFKVVDAARISSDLALATANQERDAAIKELGELRKAYDLVCSSKLTVVEENRALKEKLATAEEGSYNAGWAAAYEDAAFQIGYISRLNFKKGWNKALLTAEVDIDSPLYDEHDPGPKPVVTESPAPAAGEVSSSQVVSANIPPVQGTVTAAAEDAGAAADKGKQPATSDQLEVVG